jgi:hypothetical protein
MQSHAELGCESHVPRHDCPDVLIDYSAKFREYGLLIHDGGRSSIGIAYCPWCGSRLPESLRDRWFAKLESLGFTDPLSQDIPEDFKSEAWYRKG